MHKELEELYTNNYKRFVNTIARKVGGRREVAEDIVQEAFIRALKFYPSFDPEIGNIGAWFNSILFNALRDEQRSNKDNNGAEVFTGNVGDLFESDSGELPADLRASIDSALSNVKNAKHKRVLTLFYILGYTSNDISMLEVNMSQSNVTTIVMRFKERNSL